MKSNHLEVVSDQLEAFLPEARVWPSGIAAVCVCLCVCPRVCVSRLTECQNLVCPHDNMWLIQARTSKFGRDIHNTLVKIIIILGDDWFWFSTSNLTEKVKISICPLSPPEKMHLPLEKIQPLLLRLLHGPDCFTVSILCRHRLLRGPGCFTVLTICTHTDLGGRGYFGV